ncbi:MAG: 2-oxoacid:acceptor oxidoreductase subunit alpha [Alphaproteobacteria bacterium]|nr:2-oxoacid:acceptor oxidoreductase subunit alpha [Alphaproteobacteria bacterium]
MADSVSIALTGSGGAGVMTAGQILLDAAAKAGLYGLMGRSTGPQIRGGEAAALVRLSTRPVDSPDDLYDVLVAFDWENVNRFAAELPLGPDSIILCDPSAGEIPSAIAAYGAKVVPMPFKEMAKAIPGARANMIGVGVLSVLTRLDEGAIVDVLTRQLGRKGEEVLKSSTSAVAAGAKAAEGMAPIADLSGTAQDGPERWNISGNEAAGVGALRGGVKFCAAYPITPGTEILEFLAPNLPKVGGVLVQAEDELASINMCIGGSFGGAASITATSGPGLALMTESLGLAVASETPVVVVDVMRGGPSTGIPTKSEQSDLNIAVYGLHGDAPHLVIAASSIGDCLFSTQWAVHLAEALQTPAIVLSDQAMGQARAIIDRPADVAFMGRRLVANAPLENYKRYAVTASGVSPMAIPGTPGGEYTADGLEHTETGTPSSQNADHTAQLDKRKRKLDQFDYGSHWADLEGEGDIAVLTFGSAIGPAREAIERAAAKGVKARLVGLRLITPIQPEKMAEALKGVSRVLVVEQTHDAQFHKFLRAHYDLPGKVELLNRAGPLPMRPGEIENRLSAGV